MKNCKLYFKKECTCEKEGYCFDSREGCIYCIDKEKCTECESDNVLDCLSCEVCRD